MPPCKKKKSQAFRKIFLNFAPHSALAVPAFLTASHIPTFRKKEAPAWLQRLRSAAGATWELLSDDHFQMTMNTEENQPKPPVKHAKLYSILACILAFLIVIGLQVYQDMEAEEKMLTNGLTEDEINILSDLLDKIIENFNAKEGEDDA